MCYHNISPFHLFLYDFVYIILSVRKFTHSMSSLCGEFKVAKVTSELSDGCGSVVRDLV